ncbi:MAG: hypothetical protein IJ525_04980 [Alphaproteobacteria bacterium]|nr:hypothetical protein [Alphaproteobacteria bacterium]
MKDFNNQTGRSMIEMLGVLAIIGVLSVGGIAGYSKAMRQYRLNKTIEQITLIAGNIRAFFAPQRSYDGLNTYTETGKAIIKKAKLVPDEMWDGDDIKDVWGNEVKLDSSEKSSTGDNQAFKISFTYVDYDTCFELLTQDWTNAGVKIIAPSSSNYRGLLYALPPLSPDQAIKACDLVYYNGGMEMYFHFDIDISSSIYSSGVESTKTLLQN